MNISPVNYNMPSQNVNFKGHKVHKEKKHTVSKVLLAAGALTAAAITGMIIAKKFPNNAIIKNITSPIDKTTNKTASKFAAAATAAAATAAATAAVSIKEETKNDVNSEKDSQNINNEPINIPDEDTVNSIPQETDEIPQQDDKITEKISKPVTGIPKQLVGNDTDKAQRLQSFIDEIIQSKVEPHVSTLENIEPADLTKPTKVAVIELQDGNKITKTTQYTKAHKIVNFVLEKPINGVKRVEQIRHPNNKMSSVNIYDSTNKIKQTSAFKYNYETGKLIDVTIYDKELGRRSKIKYVYNDNFTRLEKVVIIGADGKIQNITKIPVSLNTRLKNSIYNIQDSFSEAGDKISDSIRRFKKTAMF